MASACPCVSPCAREKGAGVFRLTTRSRSARSIGTDGRGDFPAIATQCSAVKPSPPATDRFAPPCSAETAEFVREGARCGELKMIGSGREASGSGNTCSCVRKRHAHAHISMCMLYFYAHATLSGFETHSEILELLVGRHRRQVPRGSCVGSQRAVWSVVRAGPVVSGLQGSEGLVPFRTFQPELP